MIWALALISILASAGISRGYYLDNSDLTASQSSTGYDGVGRRAIDGNTNGQWGGGSCTHTVVGRSNNWWEVDLSEVYNIRMVEIYNRRDCCSPRLNNAKVFAVEGGRKQLCGRVIYSGSVSTYEIQCGGVSADHIRIELDENRPLTLCEVKIEVGDSGLSGHRIPANDLIVSQSSQYRDGGRPELAIDGRRNDNWNQGSCTHTREGRSNNWWRVDLGSANFIERVEIFNRRDCCGNRLGGAEVYAVLEGEETHCGTVEYQGNIYQYVISCGGAMADAIVIKNNNILTLCEVEVYVSDSACTCNSVSAQQFDMTNVEWDLGNGEVSEEPPVLAESRLVSNGGSQLLPPLPFTISQQVREESSFSHTAGASVTVGATFQVGVPFIAGGEISTSLSASYEYTSGSKRTDTTTITRSFSCPGPPRKVTECDAVLFQYRMTVGYKMYWTHKLDDSCVCEESGVFEDISGSRLELTIKETDI